MAPTRPLSLNKSNGSKLPNADVLRQAIFSASASIHFNTLKVRKIYSYSESRKFIKTRIVYHHLLLLLLLLFLLLLLLLLLLLFLLLLLLLLLLQFKRHILAAGWCHESGGVVDLGVVFLALYPHS